MLFMIAWRNLLRNWKRSILFGLSLSASCFFFLASSSLGNGIASQSMSRFRDFQSGDVAVVWDTVDKLDPDDPGRLLIAEINIKKDMENLRAMEILNGFFARHAGEIEAIYGPVRATGMLDSGRFAAYAVAYGLEREELDYFFQSATVTLREGAPLFDYEYAAYISAGTALETGLSIGDWFDFDCPTVLGPVNTGRFQIAGIYRSGAPWDNIYFYTRTQYARELLAIDAPYWSSLRIFLKNPGNADIFLGRLRFLIRKENLTIRAESFHNASVFWSNFSRMQKEIIAYFSLLLILVIGTGIRAGVRMNAYNRMPEFGTMRAIGYGRKSIFFVIAMETAMLSLGALTAALSASLVFVLVAGFFGVHVAGFGFEYITGSEYLYPVIDPVDLIFPMIALAVLALLSPLKPSLRILYQRIPDMLSKNARQIFASVIIINKIFGKRKMEPRSEERDKD